MHLHQIIIEWADIADIADRAGPAAGLANSPADLHRQLYDTVVVYRIVGDSASACCPWLWVRKPTSRISPSLRGAYSLLFALDLVPVPRSGASTGSKTWRYQTSRSPLHSLSGFCTEVQNRNDCCMRLWKRPQVRSWSCSRPLETCSRIGLNLPHARVLCDKCILWQQARCWILPKKCGSSK